MAITKDDIIKALEDMKLTELNDLVKSIEEHFGVVAAVATALATGAAAGAAAAQTEFNVMLTNIGPNKVNVIKIVKEITELGLMEAKKLVEGTLPVLIKENLPTEKAEKAKKDLMDAGASIDLK